MAVDQDLLDRIAGTVADLYRSVEASLVTVIADELKRDLPAPTAEVKLDAIRRLRAAAEQVQARLNKTKSAAVREAIRTAYRSGTTSALTSIPTDILTKIRAKEAMEQVPGTAVIENLAQALHRDLGRVESNILRAPEDAYRAVQAATAARIATGTATRRQASQAAWQRLMDKGIGSFTDSAGRQWRLSSYAEMIGRTNIARAAVQGQMDRLASIGIDLVYISDNVQECKVCRPFESKVLRRDSGPTGRIQVEHGTRDGELVDVDVLDTLDQARAKGLFHPNCRHSASAYLPGITKLKKATADPEGDIARQKQRALERKIRSEKEKALGALTPEAKKQANARVRAAQAQLRDHLAKHPKLKRLPYREQIGAGNHPPAGGPKGGPVGDLTPPPPSTGPAPKKAKADPAAKAAAKAKAAQEAAEKAAQEAAEQAEADRLTREAAERLVREAAEKAARTKAVKARPLGDIVPNKGAPVDEAAIEKALREGLEGTYAGHGVKLAKVVAKTNSVKAKFDITDSTGRKIGVTERTFVRVRGELVARHDLLKLDPGIQGQGFAKAWNGALTDWYKASGASRIELLANIDVGGYAWASNGYDFANANDANNSVIALRNATQKARMWLTEHADQAGTDEYRAQQAAIAAGEALIARAASTPFGSDGYPSAWEISQVGRQPGQGREDVWIGKSAMLGGRWKGVKWL